MKKYGNDVIKPLAMSPIEHKIAPITPTFLASYKSINTQLTIPKMYSKPIVEPPIQAFKVKKMD